MDFTMNNEKKIAVIIPYFGRWPEWIDYFFLSCINNPSIDWIFPTDCPVPGVGADNLRFVPLTLQDLNEIAGLKLDLYLDIRYPYKICDLRPAYGEIFNDLIRDYDFWGYGDLDLVYGNIRKFVPDPSLDNYDIISNHTDFITGHFCLLRNTPEINELFKTGGTYRSAFKDKYYTGFDEQLKKFRINPYPKYLERQLALDRKAHRTKYRILKQIKRYLPTGIRLSAGKNPIHSPDDFSSIVKNAENTSRIRVSYARTFESDLMLIKQGIKNWEMTWKNGVLANKESKELCYFHFILSKSRESFKVKKYQPGINEFMLSPQGIS
jgi:hypothetical protein